MPHLVSEKVREFVATKLAQLDLEVREHEPLAKHTTLRLGGPADAWIEPRSVESLAELLARADAADIPVSCVGGGSNLLVRDAGIRGIVLHLRYLNQITAGVQDDPFLWHVQAGAHTSKLLASSLLAGQAGLEFLAGVPGLVGGGLRMNAGTYLGEFTQVVQSVRSVDRAGVLVQRDHAACGFAYRHSDLPVDEIIVDTMLRLSAGDKEEMQSKVAELRARKHAREPKAVGNNGSTFKNPPGDFAGRLIEAAGLKGFQIGGAQVSPVHANWLVNADPQRCTSADLVALISHVQRVVREHHGIALETEVKIVGDDAPASA